MLHFPAFFSLLDFLSSLTAVLSPLSPSLLSCHTSLLLVLLVLLLLVPRSLTSCPELVCLLEEGEELDGLLALQPEAILLRWFNYHLERVSMACSAFRCCLPAAAVPARCYNFLHAAVLPCAGAAAPRCCYCFLAMLPSGYSSAVATRFELFGLVLVGCRGSCFLAEGKRENSRKVLVTVVVATHHDSSCQVQEQ